MDIHGKDIIGLSDRQNLNPTELSTLVRLADGDAPSDIAQATGQSTLELRHTEMTIRAKLGALSKPHMITRGFILGVLIPRALCCLLSICAGLNISDDQLRTRQQRPSVRIGRNLRGGRDT